MVEGAKNAADLILEIMPDIMSNQIVNVFVGLVIICMLFVYFFGKLFPRE